MNTVERIGYGALIVKRMYEPAPTEGVGGWPAWPALLSIGMTAERYRTACTYIITRDVCCLRLFVIHRADTDAAAVTVA